MALVSAARPFAVQELRLELGEWAERTILAEEAAGRPATSTYGSAAFVASLVGDYEGQRPSRRGAGSGVTIREAVCWCTTTPRW